MIFDTIYSFYYDLFSSYDGVSGFWSDFPIVFWNSVEEMYYGFSSTDYISVICTVVTIICGIFALFRILGGVLKLFKV